MQDSRDFSNTVLINKLHEITRQLFETYLTRCDSPEYQFRWLLQAEPIESIAQFHPEHGDAMQFSLSFDPQEEIMKLEIVFRATRPKPEE
jgi:hypothetical protein